MYYLCIMNIKTKDTTLQALVRVGEMLGLWVAVLWSGSFLCYMWGLTHPWLSVVSLFLGVYSVVPAGRAAGLYRAFAPEGGRRRYMWLQIMIIYLFATLLTTLVQYLYFRYLDGGQLMATFQKSLALPEMRQMVDTLPEGTVDQCLRTLADPAALAFNCFTANVMLSLLLSLPALMYGFAVSRRAKKL